MAILKSVIKVNAVFYIFILLLCTTFQSAGQSTEENNEDTLLSTKMSSSSVQPGMYIVRYFDNISFGIYVNEEIAKVEIEVMIDGFTVDHTILTVEENIAILDLQSDSISIKGSLSALFRYPSNISKIRGDWVVQSGSDKKSYRGEIIYWEYENPVVVKKEVEWILPDLNIVSEIYLESDQLVNISFYTGPQLMMTSLLSLGVNTVVISKEIEVGSVTIYPNSVLTLQINTPMQQGQVMLDGTFSSMNTEKINYKGVIAAWNYP